ncbi:MAG: LPS export ABC transporter periplasmic protein LptC [Gammaproteobacteria bacterium]|nr:LPS export ABC transporter periplasmic protein LptC [Gammaproteobacteria bacterium]
MRVKLPNKRWILALGPAVLTMWLLSGNDDSSVPQPEETAGLLPGQEQYEGFGRGISSIIYDENGFQAYTLHASEQRQFPNQLTELDLPHVQMFDGRSEMWNISAASGRIRATSAGDILQLDLEDAVEVLHQPATDNLIRLTTERMTIEPPTQTLFTSASVHVVGNGIDMTASGLFADLAINLLNFNSDIQGRYYRARN